MPGQIGLIQATEAIKFILGIGESLVGRFLIYDALEMDFKVFVTKKDDTCPLCGNEPVIFDLAPPHDNEKKQLAACNTYSTLWGSIFCLTAHATLWHIMAFRLYGTPRVVAKEP